MNNALLRPVSLAALALLVSLGCGRSTSGGSVAPAADAAADDSSGTGGPGSPTDGAPADAEADTGTGTAPDAGPADALAQAQDLSPDVAPPGPDVLELDSAPLEADSAPLAPDAAPAAPDAKPVPILRFVAPDLRDGIIDFGDVRIGTGKTVLAQVENRGSAGAKGLHFILTNADQTIRLQNDHCTGVAVLGPGASCDFQVFFGPSGVLGPHGAALRVDDQSGGEIDVIGLKGVATP